MKQVDMNKLTEEQINELIKQNSNVDHPKMPSELFLGVLLCMIALVFIMVSLMGYHLPTFMPKLATFLIVVPGGFGIRYLYLYKKRLPVIKTHWDEAQKQLTLLKKEISTRHEFYLSHQAA